MVLGETYKPVSPRAKPPEEAIIPLKKPINGNDTFAIKYTFSFLAAVCSETSRSFCYVTFLFS